MILPLLPLFTVDAVYAMAHALDSMVRTTCEEPLIGPLSRHKAEAEAAAGFFGSRWLCPALLPKPDGADLLAYVRNVSFVSKFVRNRDGGTKPRYVIYLHVCCISCLFGESCDIISELLLPLEEFHQLLSPLPKVHE